MIGITMNDGGGPDAGPCEELRLIRAFLRLTDPGRRQRVLQLAEQLAEEAGLAAAAPAYVATDGSAPGPIRDFPGPIE